MISARWIIACRQTPKAVDRIISRVAATLIVTNAMRVDANILADGNATVAGGHEAEAAFADRHVDFVMLQRTAVIFHVATKVDQLKIISIYF